MDQTQICNAALLYAKSSARINNINDNTVAARYCRTHFDATRKEVLRAVEWNFARGHIDLSLHSDPAAGNFRYRYYYPNNAITIRRLVAERRGAPAPPFELALNAAGDAKTVLTDRERARAEITVDVQNVELFDIMSADAFAINLASRIVIPLGGSRAFRLELLEMYQQAMATASAMDGNEYSADEPDLPDHLLARG